MLSKISMATGILAVALSTSALAAPIGSGALSGSFENPDGPLSLVVDGVGTDTVETGTPVVGSSPTTLALDTVDFVDQPKGEAFVGGLIRFFNGSVNIGSAFTSIDIVVDSVSDDPDFNQQLVETLTFDLTPNLATNTDEQNADTLFFQSRPELGGFRVFENEFGIVELLLEFNSLDLIGFGDVLTPDIAFLTADPFAPVDPGFTATVPVPGTWSLLLAGLLGLGSMARRRQNLNKTAI